MLGATPGKTDPLSSRHSRKPREKALDFHVSLPAGSDGATARLARKIRESIARTIEREASGDCRVTVSGQPDVKAKPERTATERQTPPGCGAWWTF